MTAWPVDLRGAELAIKARAGQPLEILFDFTPTDVSAFAWLGQVRSDPASVTPLASFAFSSPAATQMIATIDKPAVDTLIGLELQFEIEQTAPTEREMFYGTLTITPDTAR